MKKKNLFIAFCVLCILATCLITALFLRNCSIPVLFPKGAIGLQQKDLMISATWLMLIIVIPVFVLTSYIVYTYRAGTKTGREYAPEWDNNIFIEGIWWGLPCIIIVALSALTWTSSHTLDPFKPITSEVSPITIQVVALDWKWLFIYPKQQIATINYIQIPENTPINFEITSDAPMNSFWLPELGGQVFAMPGMKTQLHLIANSIGTFNGASANLSGEGFAGMTFTTQATTVSEFTNWVATTQLSQNFLTRARYITLAKPSMNNGREFFSLKDASLFEWIVMKYMMPLSSSTEDSTKSESKTCSKRCPTMPPSTTTSCNNH